MPEPIRAMLAMAFAQKKYVKSTFFAIGAVFLSFCTRRVAGAWPRTREMSPRLPEAVNRQAVRASRASLTETLGRAGAGDHRDMKADAVGRSISPSSLSLRLITLRSVALVALRSVSNCLLDESEIYGTQ